MWIWFIIVPCNLLVEVSQLTILPELKPLKIKFANCVIVFRRIHVCIFRFGESFRSFKVASVIA